MNVDRGLENLRWIRGLRRERVPAASYAVVPTPQNSLLAIEKGLKYSVACFLHSSFQIYLCQTPRWRRRNNIGRVVNTVRGPASEAISIRAAVVWVFPWCCVLAGASIPTVLCLRCC